MISLTRRFLFQILNILFLLVIIAQSAPIAVLLNEPSQTLTFKNLNKRFIVPFSAGIIGLGMKKIPEGTTFDES
ncbi:10107_t:CDS:1, partial [Dentiscutata erythropus]